MDKIPDFTQVCVWPGTVVGQDKIVDFEEFMKKTFDTRIKYIEEIKTFPGDGGEGGRNDIFFSVHNEDVAKFAVPRLSYGIRWIEDVLSPENYHDPIYPPKVFEYKTW